MVPAVFVLVCLSTFARTALPQGLSSEDVLSHWQQHYRPEALHIVHHLVPYAALPSPVSAEQWSVRETDADNDTCHQDLTYLLLSLTEQWTLQMLDAAGKIPSALLKGSFNWLGSYQECVEVTVSAEEETVGQHRIIGTKGFQGQYCTTSWRLKTNISSTPIPLSIGICVPDSCSAEQLKNGTLEFINYIDSIKWLKNHSLPLSFTDISCKPKEAKWTGLGIFCLCVYSILICLMVAGTVLDVLNVYYRDSSKYQNFNDILPESTVPSTNHDPAIVDDYSNAESRQYSVVRFQRPSLGNFTKFLLCFSVYTNGKKLLNVSDLQGQLTCLHGIRFLSMCWVILGHTYTLVFSVTDSPLSAIKALDSFAFQAILQGTFSVDTFFMLSGLLLTYLFMKEVSKTDGKISWIYFYVHRWWRLTPLLCAMMVTYLGVLSHLGSGPLWGYDGPADQKKCSENWWQNLLYINNFFNFTDTCMGWTWYLANDMQFYVISPLFLWPLWKWPLVGFGAVGALFAASWISTFAISYNQQSGNAFDLANLQQPVQVNDFMNDIYIKPYCRIATYLVGVLLGYLLYKAEVKDIRLPKVSRIIFWLLSTAGCLAVVYGLYHVHLRAVGTAFYNALSRTTFIVGVAWVTFACIRGYGGPVNTLLSWRFWVPLSRLTYAAYLVHPMVMIWFFTSQQSLFHFGHPLMVAIFLAMVVMSYSIGMVFSLAFEAPMLAIEKLLRSRKN